MLFEGMNNGFLLLMLANGLRALTLFSGSLHLARPILRKIKPWLKHICAISPLSNLEMERQVLSASLQMISWGLRALTFITLSSGFSV